MKIDTIFNFEADEDDEIATGSNPPEPGAITEEIIDEARKLAESSKGLDIESFQRKHKIHILNVDKLLRR